jgi:hypothetical protein
LEDITVKVGGLDSQRKIKKIDWLGNAIPAFSEIKSNNLDHKNNTKIFVYVQFRGLSSITWWGLLILGFIGAIIASK